MVSSKNTRGVGSCKKLEGKIYCLSVFVSLNGFEWNNQSVASMFQMIYQAEEWLKKQAKRYGKSISFENGSYGADGFVRATTYMNLQRARVEDSYNYFAEIMRTIGYQDMSHFYDWAKKQKGADNSLILFCFNTDDRSFAYSATSGMLTYNYSKYNSEFAVVYRAVGGAMSTAGVFAHEMLHLFGAWDMYPSQYLTKEQSDTAARMYPKSIMIDVSEIEKREIDEVNAWLVGLGPEKNYFRWFQSKTAYGEEYEVDSKFDDDKIVAP